MISQIPQRRWLTVLTAAAFVAMFAFAASVSVSDPAFAQSGGGSSAQSERLNVLTAKAARIHKKMEAAQRRGDTTAYDREKRRHEKVKRRMARLPRAVAKRQAPTTTVKRQAPPQFNPQMDAANKARQEMERLFPDPEDRSANWNKHYSGLAMKYLRRDHPDSYQAEVDRYTGVSDKRGLVTIQNEAALDKWNSLRDAV